MTETPQDHTPEEHFRAGFIAGMVNARAKCRRLRLGLARGTIGDVRNEHYHEAIHDLQAARRLRYLEERLLHDLEDFAEKDAAEVLALVEEANGAGCVESYYEIAGGD